MPTEPHRAAAEVPPTGETYWRADDLGKALPNEEHAISVCLPRWQDVIDYEEGRERVMSALRAGYPRFVLPPALRELHRQLDPESGGALALAFGSEAAAERCVKHVEGAGGLARCLTGPPGVPAWVRFGCGDSMQAGWLVWRTFGEGLSSRAARAVLDGVARGVAEETAAGDAVRRRIADEHGVDPGNVFLTASGMAAVGLVARLVARARPGLPLVQLDFPYVDVPRLLRMVAERIDVPRASHEALAALEARIREGRVGGLFTEVPANPLLGQVDLARLGEVARTAGVPIVGDDTVASNFNIGLLPQVDLVTCSLSKWFNGRCNLLAGAVVVNPEGKHAAQWKHGIEQDGITPPGAGDLIELEKNSLDFPARMKTINRNAAAAIEWMRGHPAVSGVWAAEADGGLWRTGRGAGGLFTFSLHGGEAVAAAFYDAVELPKGPSFGADFTMLCPYTLLAHYDELEDVARLGVRRDQIRISIGREPQHWILERLEAGLAAATRA